MAYVEPSEFEEHVQLFDRVFKCYPLNRDEMRKKLDELSQFPISVHDDLLDYVMELQQRALFGLRLGLLVEELGEWTETVLKDKSKEEQAKEMADVEYVLHGANDTLGYNADAARGFVMDKNHKKIANKDQMKASSSGKLIKPEDQ